MSACWASRIPGGRPGGRTLVGISLALALLVPAAAGARVVSASRDSGRVARRVVIGEQGIQISGGDSLGMSAHGVSTDVNADRRRVRILPTGVEVTDGGRNVRVMGPEVRVDGDGNDRVRVFGDAEVPAGERVDGDVVAVFGSVTIHGQITGSAVAVFGTVTLDSSARVEGDAVAVGGSLEAAPGSTVGGESVSLAFLPIAWGLPALPIVLLTILLGWLSSLFLGWLLHVLFADRMLRAAVTASRRTGLSFVLGLASAPLMVIAFVLLFITVLGIPLALLLPIAYWLLMWAGQLASSYVLGCKLMGRRLADRWAFAPLALGTLFVAAFFVAGAVFSSGSGFLRGGALFFDLLGLLLLTGLTVIGTGAFLVSRLGAQPSDLHARPHEIPGTAAPLSAAVAPLPRP